MNGKPICPVCRVPSCMGMVRAEYCKVFKSEQTPEAKLAEVLKYLEQTKPKPITMKQQCTCCPVHGRNATK